MTDHDSCCDGGTTCGRCGAAFVCGLAAGAARCWCFDLPHVLPVEAGRGCLCPECLRAAMAIPPGGPKRVPPLPDAPRDAAG